MTTLKKCFNEANREHKEMYDNLGNAFNQSINKIYLPSKHMLIYRENKINTNMYVYIQNEILINQKVLNSKKKLSSCTQHCKRPVVLQLLH